jgi:hypothetical protein
MGPGIVVSSAVERFPADFSELLSERGRAVLEGRDALCGVLRREPFAAVTGLLDEGLARQVPALLEKAFGEMLVPIERGLPSNRGGDLLPKVARMRSTPTEGPAVVQALTRGGECGLVGMLRSRAYLELCQQLAGRPLDGPVAMQALCIAPGDYAGPHTDHVPNDPQVRDGYTDVHFTFCTDGVHRQLLVYERGQHLSHVVPIVGFGAVTAYRLPLWHYTTPLEGEPHARRWVVLGTFADRVTAT